MKRLLVFLFLISMIWVMFSCSESKFVEPEEPTFQVSGIVYSEYCIWWLDAWFPYSDSLHLAATITCTDTLTGTEYVTQTNSASFYNNAIPEGVYYLEVETPHSRPRIRDTLLVTKDTIIDLYSGIEWLWHDTIIVEFYYQMGDTLPLDLELALIQKLDSTIGGCLYPENSWRDQFDPEDPNWLTISNQHHVPFDTSQRPWQLEDELREIVNSDTLTYPTSMYVRLKGFGCLHADRESDENNSSIALE